MFRLPTTSLWPVCPGGTRIAPESCLPSCHCDHFLFLPFRVELTLLCLGSQSVASVPWRYRQACGLQVVYYYNLLLPHCHYHTLHHRHSYLVHTAHCTLTTPHWPHTPRVTSGTHNLSHSHTLTFTLTPHHHSESENTIL